MCSVEQMVMLYREGLSKSEIGRRLGVPHQRVSKVLCSVGEVGRNFNFIKNLSSRQRSLVIGTVLGDAGLKLTSAGSILYFRHGLPQKEYLLWKVAQFGSLFTESQVAVTPKKDGNFVVQRDSRRHPLLTEYYKLFYSRPDNECTEHIHKKRITPEILAQVNDEALAIWFCDDGTYVSYGGKCQNVMLCMGGMTISEYELVESWFQNQGFDVSRHAWFDSGSNAVKLYFSKESSRIICSRMNSYVPECMRYKFVEV